MNAKRIIGFDLDGVILDHTALKQELVKRYGISLAARDTTPDRMKHLLPAEIYEEIKRLLYDDREVSLRPVLWNGAKETLAVLRSRGIPYVLISRRKSNPQLAIQVLKKHGLFPELFNGGNTFFVTTKEEKNKKAEELGVTMYFDDQPSVLGELIAVPQKFLFDPMNAYPKESRFHKAHSWNDILKHALSAIAAGHANGSLS